MATPKRIGGKTYWLEWATSSKTEAQKFASNLRKKGYRVRVLGSKQKGYTVWKD